MITLKPAEETLRDLLIDRARTDPKFISHGELAEAMDNIAWRISGPRFQPVTNALTHVNTYEMEHGRPMVGALAVTRSPSSAAGFAGLARNLGLDVPETVEGERQFCRDELVRAVAYWSEHEDDPAGDARHDAIMGELATIKRMLRTLVHA
jgi:hypothetical protein